MSNTCSSALRSGMVSSDARSPVEAVGAVRSNAPRRGLGGTFPFVFGLAGGAGLACGVWMLATAPAPQVSVIALSERLEAAEMRLAVTEVERHEAERRRDEATERLASLHRALSRAEDRLREAEAGLATAEKQRRADEAERRRLSAALDGAETETRRLRLALAEAEGRHSGLAASFDSIGEAIDTVIAERDFALARSAALSDTVSALAAQKEAVEARQQALITDLEAFATSGIDGLERMFGAAQIDVSRLTAEVERDYSGQGGPFEAITLARLEPEGEGEGTGGARLGTLMSDLERLSLMHFAAERVPFAKPVRGARLTSGFGPRRDPIRRRYSMHNGIDFAGPRGMPIYATASGVVTFVGRQRGYGKVVEIRHAFGFETLYAHMSKTRVRLGERVEKGDRIGDMGSTGRSTGVHVHYEVRLNDRPVNPMTFIEAARDVL